jgi:hypothetical protein
MDVPQLQALDAVAGAVQAAIDAGDLRADLKVVKTLRPRVAFERMGRDTTLIVHVSAVTSETNVATHDEYQVVVSCSLLMDCNASETDPHDMERTHAELAQSIADQLRKRISVSTGYFAHPEAGLIEEAELEELNLLCSTIAGTYRIQHEIPT